MKNPKFVARHEFDLPTKWKSSADRRVPTADGRWRKSEKMEKLKSAKKYEFGLPTKWKPSADRRVPTADGRWRKSEKDGTNRRSIRKMNLTSRPNEDGRVADGPEGRGVGARGV